LAVECHDGGSDEVDFLLYSSDTENVAFDGTHRERVDSLHVSFRSEQLPVK